MKPSSASRAHGLSGGQAQRIALARAFLLDAPLVILDEATANLDPEEQGANPRLPSARLLDRPQHAPSSPTGSTPSARADRIVVLDAGGWLETGTHAELMRGDGLYRRLVQAGAAKLGSRGRGARERGAVGGRGARRNITTKLSQPGMHNTIIRYEIRNTELAPHSTLHAPRPPPLALLPCALLALGCALRAAQGFITVGSSIGRMWPPRRGSSPAALPARYRIRGAAGGQIVGVRFFGIARGVFRYLERLASHQVTFRVLRGYGCGFRRVGTAGAGAADAVSQWSIC